MLGPALAIWKGSKQKARHIALLVIEASQRNWKNAYSDRPYRQQVLITYGKDTRSSVLELEILISELSAVDGFACCRRKRNFGFHIKYQDVQGVTK